MPRFTLLISNHIQVWLDFKVEMMSVIILHYIRYFNLMLHLASDVPWIGGKYWVFWEYAMLNMLPFLSKHSPQDSDSYVIVLSLKGLNITAHC